MVYQDSGAGSRKRVNQLFKADFFGEGALLSDEPRWVRGIRLGRGRQAPEGMEEIVLGGACRRPHACWGIHAASAHAHAHAFPERYNRQLGNPGIALKAGLILPVLALPALPA